ncbi:pentapeptide repeat-containing protein [Caballeronia sp. LZ043]|uniref:pentapeptide repeat-containing protein n=1 Tax=Caballeronia sp. LZ043 TaxID=3038569 RepID=UPI00285F59D5|nr:pentapeptide repeat-containing protein [Caballeronia sp. LZ043]MDR5822445.1 pentapeptide repeat-containing protein [Caballeronia sp. LZ043]
MQSVGRALRRSASVPLRRSRLHVRGNELKRCGSHALHRAQCLSDGRGVLRHGARPDALSRRRPEPPALPRRDLSLCQFTGATLTGADFRDARLVQTRFEGAVLEGACFANATGRYARFGGALLAAADFTGAVFTVADFNRAILTGARCDAVQWEQANFTGAQCQRSTHAGARFTPRPHGAHCVT